MPAKPLWLGAVATSEVARSIWEDMGKLSLPVTNVGRAETVVDVTETVGDGIAAAARPALKCGVTQNWM